MIARICRALARLLNDNNAPTRKKSMKVRTGGNAVVKINGHTYTGSSIDIVGGKVMVDGVEQTQELIGPISVTVNGSAQSVTTASGDITVVGTVNTVSTTSGDVACGDVRGGVSTVSGDVECRSIGGAVSTISGDISKAR
jgi:hypothetical protein